MQILPHTFFSLSWFRRDAALDIESIKETTRKTFPASKGENFILILNESSFSLFCAVLDANYSQKIRSEKSLKWNLACLKCSLSFKELAINFLLTSWQMARVSETQQAFNLLHLPRVIVATVEASKLWRFKVKFTTSCFAIIFLLLTTAQKAFNIPADLFACSFTC